jgi:hypothetical protein
VGHARAARERAPRRPQAARQGTPAVQRPRHSLAPAARDLRRTRARGLPERLQNGDFTYAGYGAFTESWPAFLTSRDLEKFVRDLTPNLALLERIRTTWLAAAHRLALQHEDPEAAARAAGAARRLGWGRGTIWLVLFDVWEALAILGSGGASSPNVLAAREAIRRGRGTESLQHQALAAELSGRLWLSRGNETAAAIYLGEARRRYREWGAAAKVRQLEERYPSIRWPRDDSAPPTLDAASVTKAAHALSSRSYWTSSCASSCASRSRTPAPSVGRYSARRMAASSSRPRAPSRAARSSSRALSQAGEGKGSKTSSVVIAIAGARERYTGQACANIP